jgi:apolipoprotein D and lipocalin family protein
MNRRLAALLLAVSTISPVFAEDVTAVRTLDLARYAGTWREIAAIPQFFQRRCASGTAAVYARLPDGMVSVNNTCVTKEGERIAAEGRARVVDPASPAKLEVTFLRFLGEWRFWFGADYWVIGLDPGYRWAVVGHPQRTYAWVLSREPRLSPPDLAAVLEVLRSQGYDACDLLITPQEGGWQERQPLCRHGAG